MSQGIVLVATNSFLVSIFELLSSFGFLVIHHAMSIMSAELAVIIIERIQPSAAIDSLCDSLDRQYPRAKDRIMAMVVITRSRKMELKMKWKFIGNHQMRLDDLLREK